MSINCAVLTFAVIHSYNINFPSNTLIAVGILKSIRNFTILVI